MYPREAAPDAAADGPASTARMQRRLHVWRGLAVLVLVVGSVASALGAVAVTRNDDSRARRAFASASAEVAARLRLAIQHEDDLIVSTSGVVAGNPDLTNAEFRKWARSVR